MPSFIQFLFQVETWREKYRKKEAVSLTTKFNSVSGPVYCLTAGCRGVSSYQMDAFFHADSVRQHGTAEILSQRI